jgi:hypothetical protein
MEYGAPDASGRVAHACLSSGGTASPCHDSIENAISVQRFNCKCSDGEDQRACGGLSGVCISCQAEERRGRAIDAPSLARCRVVIV